MGQSKGEKCFRSMKYDQAPHQISIGLAMYCEATHTGCIVSKHKHDLVTFCNDAIIFAGLRE